MEEETKKYFGMKVYTDVVDTGKTTPSGVKIIEVLFEDGTKEKTTETLFEIIKASVPVDLTKQRELMTVPLVQKIFSLFTDFNLKLDDINHISDSVVNTYNMTLKHATEKLFGTDHMGNLKMLSINEVNEQKDEPKQ